MPWRGLQVEYPTAVPDLSRSPQGSAALRDEGVVVTEVQEGTPAWEAGIRPGMLIGRVDRRPVETPGQFRAAVAGKSGPVRLHLPGETENRDRTVGPES